MCLCSWVLVCVWVWCGFWWVWSWYRLVWLGFFWWIGFSFGFFLVVFFMVYWCYSLVWLGCCVGFGYVRLVVRRWWCVCGCLVMGLVLLVFWLFYRCVLDCGRCCRYFVECWVRSFWCIVWVGGLGMCLYVNILCVLGWIVWLCCLLMNVYCWYCVVVVGWLLVVGCWWCLCLVCLFGWLGGVYMVWWIWSSVVVFWWRLCWRLMRICWILICWRILLVYCVEWRYWYFLGCVCVYRGFWCSCWLW